MWTLSDNRFPAFKVLPSHPVLPRDSSTANFLILEIDLPGAIGSIPICKINVDLGIRTYLTLIP